MYRTTQENLTAALPWGLRGYSVKLGVVSSFRRARACVPKEVSLFRKFNKNSDAKNKNSNQFSTAVGSRCHFHQQAPLASSGAE